MKLACQGPSGCVSEQHANKALDRLLGQAGSSSLHKSYVVRKHLARVLHTQQKSGVFTFGNFALNAPSLIL